VRASLELPGLALRYTTDGSEPTAKSPVVSGPIIAASRALVRVAAFDATGRKGQTASLTVP
jgi:hexosaminidase